jgi:tRNA(fMet)-specific endonuclease VapC
VSARFLLDTKVVSEPLRPQPSAKLLDQLRRYSNDVVIAALTWHELWYGCQRLAPSAKRSAIETYLSDVVALTMPVLPYDERAAEWHAAERARLVGAGKTPTFVAGQIAAVAVTNGLTLVTRNLADYTDFSGLSVTDWTR